MSWTCKKCHWKFVGKNSCKICGYCLINKKLGIHNLAIPQTYAKTPAHDLTPQQVKEFTRLFSR